MMENKDNNEINDKLRLRQSRRRFWVRVVVLSMLLGVAASMLVGHLWYESDRLSQLGLLSESRPLDSLDELTEDVTRRMAITLLRWVALSEIFRNFGLTAFGVFGSLFAVVGYILARDRLENEENKRDDERRTRFDERYAQAITMLGHDQSGVRSGGVFELEQLGQTSKIHLERAIRSLQSYMRDKSVSKMGSVEGAKCNVDVQDALAAYSTLLRLRDEMEPNAEQYHARRRLNRLHLVGYDGATDLYLTRCSLEGSDLRSTDLEGADLSGSDLEDANLGGADLQRVNLSGALLGNANLSRANLFGATITRQWDQEDDVRNPTLGDSRFGESEAESLHALGWPVLDRSKMLFFENDYDAFHRKDPLSEDEVREAIGLSAEGEGEG